MSGVKKKKLKFRLAVGISILIVIVACFAIFFISKNKSIYKIENRVKDMELSQLKKEEDVVGWIRVQGTNIDYPIIYNHWELDLATINYPFVWTNGDERELSNRKTIIGHNLLNVSKKPLIGDKNHTKFEQLMAYIYPSFVEENKYIQYTVGDENYIYAIFSVSFVDDSKIDYYEYDYSKEQLKNYIEEAKEDSYFDFDIEVDENDKIITLVTCTRMFGYEDKRMLKIEAKLLDDDEKSSNYSFKVKDSYNEIKEIMEGDEENEEA